MDLGDISDPFSDMSEEVLALLSGVAMIITFIFFTYAIVPLYGDHSWVVWFSLLSLFVCFGVPIFLNLSDITLVPDMVGWLLSGIMLALFGWIIFHAGYYEDVLSLQYIIPSGLLGFSSSYPLTKGVLVPLLGEGAWDVFESEEEFEEEELEEEEEFDEEFEEEEELEEFEEFEEEGFEEEPEEEKSFEEDEGPW
ncbi:MAG: hypothetical protein ACOCTR_02215 [Candidatus Natronoplasma sp.]